MRRLAAAIVAGTVVLGLAGVASGATIFGANEDWPKFAEDTGAAIYGQLQSAGMTQNVISVKWDPAAPTAIEGADRLGRAIGTAQARGVAVVLAVYPAKARAVADAGVGGFVDYCEQVARAFPGVGTFIVGNEPNQPRFWQPQFDSDGRQASAAAFLPALAGCYDRLHALGRRVIGVGLSPRGNDNPVAPSNISTSPVRFIAALGAAYRASGRTAPIMDAFSFHPYPNLNTDAPSVGYRWPNIGVPNLDRLKQALWDAFAGTAQPTPADGLPIALDEVGWQVDTQGLGGYSGTENVPTVDAETQARYHAEVVQRAACDPAVESLNFFHWIDEGDRDRFQSGEYLQDGTTARPSAEAIRGAIASTQGGTACVAPFSPGAWQPATAVLQASADFGTVADKPAAQTAFAFSASADENAQAVYGLVQVAGPGTLTTSDAAAVEAQLRAQKTASAARALPEVVVAKETLLKAYFKPRLQLAAGGLARGWYVYAVALAAESNPARKAFFVSRAFAAGKGTLPAAPGSASAATGPASRVLLESALLNGAVKAPRGSRLEAWFEYGPGATLTRTTKVQRFVGSDPTISAQLRNLSPRAKWSYRLVVRTQGKPATALRGATRSFTLAKPVPRRSPLLVVAGLDEQRRGLDLDAVVSATSRVTVTLAVRRLPAGGAAGDRAFRQVDAETKDAGAGGEDLFLTLRAEALARGTYLARVAATAGVRSTVRVVRFGVG